MFYILYGQDDYSLQNFVGSLKSKLSSPDLLPANMTVIDASSASLDQLVNACSSVPFMAEGRLVLVTGLLARFEWRGSKKRDRSAPQDTRAKEMEKWQGLKEFVGRMPPTTTLVLIESEVSQDNALLRLLSPLAEVKVYNTLSGQLLRDWVIRKTAEDGGTIQPAAAAMLAEFIGGDLWAISAEIAKLNAYAAGKAITAENVRHLVSQSKEPNIFSFMDAVLEGRGQSAHSLLAGMVNDGVSPLYLLVRLTAQVGLMIRVKEIGDAAPAEEVKQRLGLADYPFKKTVKQSRIYTLNMLKEIHRILVETDRSIKTGRSTGELALDLLIADLGAITAVRSHA